MGVVVDGVATGEVDKVHAVVHAEEGASQNSASELKTARSSVFAFPDLPLRFDLLPLRFVAVVEVVEVEVEVVGSKE